MKTSLRTVMLIVMCFALTTAFYGPNVWTSDRVISASYTLLLFILMLMSYSVTGASIACDRTGTLQSALSGILIGFYLACGVACLVVFNFAPPASP
jgi:hypothetical protein